MTMYRESTVHFQPTVRKYRISNISTQDTINSWNGAQSGFDPTARQSCCRKHANSRNLFASSPHHESTDRKMNSLAHVRNRLSPNASRL
ncbi:hypothetical protein BN3659_00048 [Alistipes sp. CHKCI003]|nr:hypothetical protein BN3659_00048 [Alistipes sp. CHKCI003]